MFGAIGDFIGGICDNIGGFFKGMINGVIWGLNQMIGALNSLSFDLPDFLGGGEIGFDIPDIPSFAVGTRYLPQDMLIQAHKGEMIVPASQNPYANSGNGQTMPGGGTQTIIVPVTLDGMNIATVTAPYSNKIQGSNLAFSGRSNGL